MEYKDQHSFHNTISAEGQMLLTFEAQAKSLEAEVESWFRYYHKVSFAWFEMAKLLPDGTHEGSIKRAITNLKTRKVIYKTSELVKGPYGKPSRRYKLC
jgi:hypothetical protein